MENLGSAAYNNRAEPWELFPEKKLKLDVCNEVAKRLMDLGLLESRSPKFPPELWEHFDRMPARYAMGVKLDKVKDVLMHKKLLELAKNPANQPAIDVRVVEKHPADDETDKPIQLKHEITCVSKDKSEFLSQLTNVLACMDLNIKEAFVVSTKDGFLLAAFVVTGSPLKKQEQLREALRKEFLKVDQDHRLDVDIEHEELVDRRRRSWWHMVETLVIGCIGVIAVYMGVVGIALMSEARSGVDVMPVGKRLLGNESDTSKNIGVAAVFVGILLLGIVWVLSLLVRAIHTSMEVGEKSG